MTAYWAGDVEHAMACATDMDARSSRSGDRFLDPTAKMQFAAALLMLVGWAQYARPTRPRVNRADSASEWCAACGRAPPSGWARCQPASARLPPWSGRTNKDIAAALFLSQKTIESHLARIYTKLNIRSRAALTAAIARADR